MKAVVIGASGQIGGWLLHVLGERGHESVGTYVSVPYPGLHKLDAADLEASAAWVRLQKPDVVFYPAGFTWVDGCERDLARAFAANLEQPLNLAKAAAESNARFVYLSTDYVFDGTAGPYSEASATNPLSAYGKSKRDAELALADALGNQVLIARTSWVFGPERQGKNFAYQLMKTLQAGKVLECPSDQISNPSYGADVAEALVMLVERGEGGLIHVVGPDLMDRPAFARALATTFGLDPALIVGKTTAELGQSTPRPLSGGLRSENLQGLLPGVMKPLGESLEHFRKALSDRDAPWASPLLGKG